MMIVHSGADDHDKHELLYKKDGQEYAQVVRMFGNGRCEAMSVDRVKRLGHICGTMHNKVWVAAGDMVLVSLRDFQYDKSDFIYKYTHDQARLLKAYGQLPDNFVRINEEDDGAGDNYIEFEQEEIDYI